jgi:hypothetical protein
LRGDRRDVFNGEIIRNLSGSSGDAEGAEQEEATHGERGS